MRCRAGRRSPSSNRDAPETRAGGGSKAEAVRQAPFIDIARKRSEFATWKWRSAKALRRVIPNRINASPARTDEESHNRRNDYTGSLGDQRTFGEVPRLRSG